MALRALVIGSGQSQAAVRAMPGVEWRSEASLPRTSMVTLGFTAVEELASLAGSQDAAEQVVGRDAARLALRLVREDQYDIIVVDLLEERLTVAGTGVGRALTVTPEYRQVVGEPDDDVCTLGSEQHRELWRRGWQAFLEEVEQAGRIDDLLVHEAYFAVQDSSGRRHPKADWLQRQNAWLASLYDLVRESLPEGRVFTIDDTDRRHRDAMVGDPITGDEGFAAAFQERFVEALAPLRAQAPVVAAGRELGRGRAGVRLLDLEEGTVEEEVETPHGRVIVRRPHRARVLGSDDGLLVLVTRSSRQPLGGLGVRLRLEGWDSPTKVEVGPSEGRAILGPRFSHLRQDTWLQEAWSLDDVVQRLHTDWSTVTDGLERTVGVRIVGRPGPDGAVLDLAWLATFTESRPEGLGRAWRERGWVDDAMARQAVAALDGYHRLNNGHWKAQAQNYLATGELPIFRDTQARPWPALQQSAVAVSDLGSYRLLHHDLGLAASLLNLAHDDARPAAAAAARDLVQLWIEDNMVRGSDDPSFAWYDHATAARTMTLLGMWAHFDGEDCDARWRARLEEVLVMHGRTLASEAFYAYCQPVRHQNHTWFADLALLALGLVLGRGELGQSWVATALARLEENLDELVVRDGDHAIWAENSVNYHAGAIALVRVSQTLVQLASEQAGDQWQRVLDGMDTWRRLLAHPDGRSPSFGDAYPVNQMARVRTKPEPEPGLHLWPTAGYALVEGGGESAYRLFVTASSRTTVHKHEDNLAISLWFDGVEWLGDPGLYNYDVADPMARYFRGHWAHSAVSLPGLDYDLTPGLARLDGHDDVDGFTLSGSHECFTDTRVERTMTGSFARLEVHGTDRVDGVPARPVTIFHLGHGVEASITGTDVVLTHPDTRLRVAIRTNGTSMQAVTGWNGEASESSLRSDGLSRCLDSTTVLVEHGDVPLEWMIEELDALPGPEECIHDRLGLPVVEHPWGSTSSQRLRWGPGVHVAALEDGQHVDVVVRGDLAELPDRAPIVVFFNGAMSQRAGTHPPYFSGNGISTRLGIPWVAISDPTLHLGGELLLGWYAASSTVQDAIVELLRDLAEHHDRRLLLVGGSGGGFAALHFASSLGDLASVFAWNPQTDVLDYAPLFVEQYLRHVLPDLPEDLPSREVVEALLAERGIIHRIEGLAAAGDILVLQNAADWHLERHLRPLMEREGWLEEDGCFVSPSGRSIARVMTWGDGHAPLPAEGVVAGLQSLLSGATTHEAAEAISEVVQPRTRKVGIVGSCVTRDAFAVAGDWRFEISRYLARTAVASLMGPATGLELNYAPLGSQFLRRTVRDDVEKSGRKWLEKGDFDVLVYDLVDERFPVLEFEDGGLVTSSWEFRQLDADTDGATTHEFTSAEHTALWERGWESFLALLERIGARDRLVVHAAPWASAIRGSDALPGAAEEIVAANSWLASRLERISQDIPAERIIMVDEQHWLADPHHQWGVSPFHYVPEYYLDFMERLSALA